MCGRYTLAVHLADLELRFGAKAEQAEPAPEQWKSRYNIAPGQELPTIVMEGGERRIRFMRWGLIPSWAKDMKAGYKMINARAESVDSKPAFREAFKSRRCIVPAQSFFEWKRVGGTDRKPEKVPFVIHSKENRIVGFAGLWETWRSPEGKLIRSFTIVTTDAAQKIRELHERMPVILEPEHEGEWLEGRPEPVRRLLVPYRGEDLVFYPVSQLVNSPANESADCIEPLVEESPRKKPGGSGGQGDFGF